MKPETKNEFNQARIKAVQKHISLHYGDELRLSELAALANMAPTSLCHVFKANTGRTMTDFIIEKEGETIKDIKISYPTDYIKQMLQYDQISN